MSLGFLTESALLPSKAKPIKVDGRSLVDLKALVFEREQRLREAAGDGDGDAAEEDGGLRRQRGARVPEAGARRREDLFSRPNRGVVERNVRDEEAREGKKRRATGMMQVKAELYEKMASGQVLAGADTLLVDFSRKPADDVELLSRAAEDLAAAAAGVASNEAGGGGSKDDDVEIQDEFGRSRVVKRGSTEARAYRKRLREEAKRRQENAAAAKDVEEDERRAAAAVRHRAAVAAGAPGGGGAWAWSSGAARGDGDGSFADGAGGGGSSSWRGSASAGGSSGRSSSKNNGIGEVLEAMAGARRGGRDGGDDAVTVSKGARVLSAWEKGLKGEEKAFLEGIRQETVEGRSRGGGAGERKRQLEERRELLRAKRRAS